LAIVLCGSAELGMVSWLPAYAERALGYTPWFAGLALMGFYIGMTTGRFGASHFAHRFDPITMLACCAAAATLLVAAGAFFPMPAAALGACVCSGFAVSCLWPTTLGLVAERYPRGGPTMFGILALIGNIGGIIMPWAIGIVADRRTLRMGIAVDGIAAVGLLIVLAFLVRQRRDLAAGIKD
jgi:fucose permease